MARFSSTTFGLMSGRYGTAVAIKKEGKNFLRPYNADSYSRESSIPQLTHRLRFSVVLKELNMFRAVINKGFTEKNAFRRITSYMLRNGVTGTYPEFKFQYEVLPLTGGRTQSVESANIVKDEVTGEAQLKWDTTVGLQSGEGAATDKVSLIFFNEKTQLCIMKNDVADREEGECSEALPQVWSDAKIHCWLYLTSENGLLSNSKYVGSFTN